MSDNPDKHKDFNTDLRINNYTNKIELLSISALLCLIAAVIMLSFNLVLAAGLVIIVAACAGIMIVRRINSLIRYLKSHLRDISLSNEKQSDFIFDFSHRIREPLNNLVIVGDLLLEASLPKKQHDLIETFVASTNNMVTAVNELTMQSATGLNYRSGKKMRFDAFSTLQDTIDLYSLKDQSVIDFTTEKDDTFNYEYFGDPIIFKQILLDIFNTIETQYSPGRKKVTINLKKGKTSGNTSFVEIRLKTGSEIDFVPEGSVSSLLAAKLVTTSNGLFRQEKTEAWTFLNISLPFITVLPEFKHQIASPKIEELSQKVKTRKELKDIKILLVEDNLINQKITLLTLRPLVNSIDTATNGKEALDKFGSSSYDLILMDIQMPVMNGVVAVEKIRALEASTNAHIPIIAITANAMLGDREQCIYAGADDYISKPFQPSALIERIKVFFQ